jgi:hypothetical protein
VAAEWCRDKPPVFRAVVLKIKQKISRKKLSHSAYILATLKS